MIEKFHGKNKDIKVFLFKLNFSLFRFPDKNNSNNNM